MQGFGTNSIGVYALIGACALLSASQQAPLMAMCLVMELTDAPLSLFVPVCLAVAASTCAPNGSARDSIAPVPPVRSRPCTPDIACRLPGAAAARYAFPRKSRGPSIRGGRLKNITTNCEGDMVSNLLATSPVMAGEDVPAGPVDPIFNRLLKDRIIWMGEEVKDDMANRICAQMLMLAALRR